MNDQELRDLKNASEGVFMATQGTAYPGIHHLFLGGLQMSYVTSATDISFDHSMKRQSDVESVVKCHNTLPKIIDELLRLREALREIEDISPCEGHAAIEIAREALQPKP